MGCILRTYDIVANSKILISPHVHTQLLTPNELLANR